MKSEKVEFKNREGNTLSGVLELPDGPVRAWALFAHCFTCSKSGLAATRLTRGLAARGIGTLRFDFTGLGDSHGDFSETGVSNNVDDLIAAAEWMNRNGRNVDLLVGHSLGGAAVVLAAQNLTQVKAIVTLAAPSEADHVIAAFGDQLDHIERDGAADVSLAGRDFTIRRAFLEDVRQAKVLDAAANLRRPYLIMHAPIDDVVGIEHANKLFVAAKHPKSFVSLDQADHLLTGADDAEFAADVICGWSRHYLMALEDVPADAEKQAHKVIVQETGASGPFQNEVLVSGRRYLADEPAHVGGTGTGPDPYEWLTAALGACTSMTLRMYARHKKWPLERVSVGIDHKKVHVEDCVDCAPGDRVDVFTRHIRLEGELDAEQRQRLLEIADRCPVHRTLEYKSVIETVEATELA